MKKLIIVHPGKQHSFETATSLKKAGLLYKYITTVYDKQGTFTNRIKGLLKGKELKKASSRRCNLLDDSDVVQIYELWGLLVILANKLKMNKLAFYLQYLLNVAFSKKVVHYAIKNNIDAIIVYDGIAPKGLKQIKQKSPHIKTIMDVSICARPFMKKVFEEDMIKNSHSGFYKTESYLWKNKYLKTIYNEFEYVDYFMAPSSIVIESLQFCGIPIEKIIKVPYGVNEKQFIFGEEKSVKDDEPLTMIFVGQLSYRKGLHLLLNVMLQYKNSEVNLILAGGYNEKDQFVRELKKLSNVKILGFVTRDVLASYYQKANIFILPSLGEGLAMVILEALGSGLPVICSNMSGGNDAIIDYKNGIVCKAGDVKSLKDSIDWFLDNRNKISKMSVEARKTAENYTWGVYHKRYAEEISKILKSR